MQADGSMQESFRLDYVAGNPNALDGVVSEPLAMQDAAFV